MSTFDQMMKAAQTALGTRYVWGGNSLTGGVDCSGFVQQVFASVGISLPRVSNLQAQSGQTVNRDQAQPGDLVWWDLNGRNQGADHIGIYLGNGKAMEASSSQGKVVVRNLWGTPHFSRVAGAGTGAAPQMTAQGATGATPANIAQAPMRKQTGLRPMATLGQGGALGLGDLGVDQDTDDDPFDLEELYGLADDNDPGEDENTVGPYNIARLMLDRYKMTDSQPQPTPRPAPQPVVRPTLTSRTAASRGLL